VTTDPRPHRVIETRRIAAGVYHLTIDEQLWSEVEWSAKRRAWCIQDAAGHCLTHVEHIHAQNPDAEAAVRIAKRMTRDGRLPTPEQAHQQLAERLEVMQSTRRDSEKVQRSTDATWARHDV
jgi:hypothetical protein